MLKRPSRRRVKARFMLGRWVTHEDIQNRLKRSDISGFDTETQYPMLLTRRILDDKRERV